MADHGAHQQQPDQPWPGQPGQPPYGGPPMPASGPPMPASGPPGNPPTQQMPGPYPPAGGPQYGQPYAPGPVSGPAYNAPGPAYNAPGPVSGPAYNAPQPTSGALVPVGAPGPGMGGEQPIAQIGEIMVTTTMVHTPVGGCPLHGSTWTSQDQWISSQKTPTWAIVLAIVGFCILTFFSLLFLLAKETVLSGVVQVTVTNGPFTYVARIPVYDHQQAQHIHNQVNYARAMAMR